MNEKKNTRLLVQVKHENNLDTIKHPQNKKKAEDTENQQILLRCIRGLRSYGRSLPLKLQDKAYQESQLPVSRSPP